MGIITDSFHFLGIHYSLTQPEDHISVKQANDDAITPTQYAQSLIELGALFNINSLSLYVSHRMHGRYAKRART